MNIDMNIVQKTMDNLKKRQFNPHYVEKKEDVLPLLEKLVPVGAAVANGGSVTLGQTGVENWLKSGRFDYLAPLQNGTDKEKKDAGCICDRHCRW